MSEYSIYAARYAGPFAVFSGYLVWQWDMAASQFERESWYLWCIRDEHQTVVVDTGADPAMTLERKRSPLFENPANVLGRLGVDAGQVEHVVLTHLHWDHAGGVRLFPRATFYVQAAEFRFWTADPIAARPPFANLADPASLEYLTSLEGTERLVLIDGDAQILPGIECLLAPGHTPGIQAVAVDTARGRAILGSDCAHVFRNIQHDWPSAFSMDLAACLRSFDRLRAKASAQELIFPGHDVLMHDNYPLVADGVTQLV
ncbi:MAG TPA: N-acyl homoserine lactonase family protein [Ilumatobacteraceae bacterium]|nr:N-acyl homoserine lactonase family protein [Ilumatobacteraceae bacterium]